DEALATLRQARTIAESRAKADLANLGWQYDLAISNERIGDLLMALGDHGEALKSYQAQQEVLSRMANGDPDRVDRQSHPAASDIGAGNVPAVPDPFPPVPASPPPTPPPLPPLAP